METEEDLAGANIEETVMFVDHAELEFADDSSYWRRNCPKCKVGVLPVMRDERFVLSLLDRCVLCGQKFIYRDIVSMRKKDGRA